MSDTLAVDPAVLHFCGRLPKVELHAHLNGSLRDATIRFARADRKGPRRETRVSVTAPLSVVLEDSLNSPVCIACSSGRSITSKKHWESAI